MKRFVFLIIAFILGYLAALVTYPQLNGSLLKDTSPKFNTPETDRPNYIVDIPAKYFDANEVYDLTTAPIPGDTYILIGGPEIKNPPVVISPAPEFEAISEDFNPREISHSEPDFGEPKVYMDLDNDGKEEWSYDYLDPVDVDGDGEKETIISASVAMTHQPHKILIIKNGKIIYRSEELMNIGIAESDSRNGFYLYNAFDTGKLPIAKGHRVTRYIHEDGKFIPVWYQDSFSLETTKP